MVIEMVGKVQGIVDPPTLTLGLLCLPQSLFAFQKCVDKLASALRVTDLGRKVNLSVK